jgi:hypothetical protein
MVITSIVWHQVPWDSVLLQLGEKRLKKPDAAEHIAARLSDAPAAAAHRHAAVLASKDVLWEINGSRVTTNVLLYASRHCLHRPVPYAVPADGLAVTAKNRKERLGLAGVRARGEF